MSNILERIDRYITTYKNPPYGREVEGTVELLQEFSECIKAHSWIPVSERLPEEGSYALLSFENFAIPDIGRYETDEEGGAFYPGDDDESYVTYGILVNAWMPLPEPYEEDEQDE